ncbi:MAG: radical SAM protein, partial [Candidatus Omnitrophica bacterium]|nr:radical SAM protein [Candidatus Omnitrophota bacterium]
INMSIEAGNDFIRENIFVRDRTRKEITTACKLMKKHGIGTFTNTILGIPAPVMPRAGDPRYDDKLRQAIRETKLAFVVAKKQVAGIRGQKYPEELDGILHELEAGNAAENVKNRGMEILQSLGLRDDPIDYDIEAVELTINCGIHETLFPRLDPYPGTVITEYTIATGAFDGNFDKLHTSCLTTSAFSCYSAEQRRIQDNLSFLGQVCAVWPWLWPVTKKYLIYWPLTRLYWFAFVLAKAHMVNRHVYPMKFNLKSALMTAYHIMMFEMKQFFHSHQEENFYKTPRKSLSRADSAGTLGGSWGG